MNSLVPENEVKSPESPEIHPIEVPPMHFQVVPSGDNVLKAFILPNHSTPCLVGSHVNNFLGLNRGALYGKHPELHARPASIEEKQTLAWLRVIPTSNLVKVTIVPLAEIAALVERSYPHHVLRVQKVGTGWDFPKKPVPTRPPLPPHQRMEGIAPTLLRRPSSSLSVLSTLSSNLSGDGWGLVGPKRSPPMPNRVRKVRRIRSIARHRVGSGSPTPSTLGANHMGSFADTFPLDETASVVVKHCNGFVSVMRRRLTLLEHHIMTRAKLNVDSEIKEELDILKKKMDLFEKTM